MNHTWKLKKYIFLLKILAIRMCASLHCIQLIWFRLLVCHVVCHVVLSCCFVISFCYFCNNFFNFLSFWFKLLRQNDTFYNLNVLIVKFEKCAQGMQRCTKCIYSNNALITLKEIKYIPTERGRHFSKQWCKMKIFLMKYTKPTKVADTISILIWHMQARSLNP